MLVRVQGHDWNVEAEGTGQVVLMVHGFPLDHSMWQGQMPALGERFRVIAPDLPGFGASHVVEGTLTMAQYADGLIALLDSLHVTEPIHFCGLSMGGYIGWEFWQRHPKRLRSFVLADTRAVSDAPEVARARQMQAQSVLHDGASVVADAMVGKLFAPDAQVRIPRIVDQTRSVMAATHPRGIAAAQRGMAERADFVRLLPEIDIPSLLVCGEHDVISPPGEMQTLAKAMPNAAFVEIPDAGHLAPLEQPHAFNECVLEFHQAI